MNFGEKLLHFRAKHNLTLRQLGDIVGVSATVLCRWELGQNKPRAINRLKVEQKLKEYERSVTGE